MKSLFNTPSVENPSLTVELSRTALKSTATAVGLLAGVIVVGTVSRKWSNRKARKNATSQATAE